MLADGAQRPGNADGTLSIEWAAISDAGVYTCVATNVAGSDEIEVTLHVQGGFWHKKRVWLGEAEEGSKTPDLYPGRVIMDPFKGIPT